MAVLTIPRSLTIPIHVRPTHGPRYWFSVLRAVLSHSGLNVVPTEDPSDRSLAVLQPSSLPAPSSVPSNSVLARGKARAPGIDKLPPELALNVLRYVSQDDLRAFSESSRNSYSVAPAAGLYISRTVLWLPICGFGDTITTLDEVLDHARTVRPQLNLVVCASFVCPAPEERPVSANDVLRLLQSITRAFPFLVRLDLSLPAVAPTAAVSALISSHRVPRLHTLNLELAAGGIPNNLFNGDAPMLCRLSLSIPDTATLSAREPVAALRNVTRLRLIFNRPAQNLEVANQFPALRVLEIAKNWSCGAQTTAIDVSNLRLDRLSVKGDGVVVTDTSGIRVVEHYSDHIPEFWPAGRDGICGRAEYLSTDTPTLTFSPRDGAWLRSVAMTKYSDRGAALPLADAPMLSQTLISLTLDKTLVNALVQTPVELRALRELLLDVTAEDGVQVWPPTSPDRLGLRLDFADIAPELLCLRCPALAHLVVFAAPRTQSVAVRPNKVTRLARALGVQDQQAALTFAGCTFFSPPVWSAFQRVFSGVSVVGDAGAYVPAYYDTCKYSIAAFLTSLDGSWRWIPRIHTVT